MGFDFNNDIPIYLQIIELIKTKIISGEYKSQQRLPSVRELSYEFGVNPNTIQKALVELEDIGLIYTERTNGKFVTQNENIIKNIKEETIIARINDFYDSMRGLGLSKKDIIDYIDRRD